MTVKGFDFSSWQDDPATPQLPDFVKAKTQAEFYAGK
jgi:hypothetical protein